MDPYRWSSKLLAVAGLLVQGYTEKEIVRMLGLSSRGATRPIARLKREAGARNLHHLTAILSRHPMFDDCNATH